MAETKVKVDRLPDGRVGVTLSGQSGGFYAWSKHDAVYLAVALMRFFEQEKFTNPEEYEDMTDDAEPVDIA